MVSRYNMCVCVCVWLLLVLLMIIKLIYPLSLSWLQFTRFIVSLLLLFILFWPLPEWVDLCTLECSLCCSCWLPLFGQRSKNWNYFTHRQSATTARLSGPAVPEGYLLLVLLWRSREETRRFRLPATVRYGTVRKFASQKLPIAEWLWPYFLLVYTRTENRTKCFIYRCTAIVVLSWGFVDAFRAAGCWPKRGLSFWRQCSKCSTILAEKNN